MKTWLEMTVGAGQGGLGGELPAIGKEFVDAGLRFLPAASAHGDVYAFEPSGIIEPAAANGFADRIEFIPKLSTECSLPEPVNIVVSDIHGILPLLARVWFSSLTRGSGS